MLENSLRIESLAKIHDELVPFRIGKSPAKIHCQPDSNRQSQKAALRLLGCQLDCLRGVNQMLRGKSCLAPYLLDLRQCHPLGTRQCRLARMLSLRRPLEYLGYLAVAVATLAHSERPSSRRKATRPSVSVHATGGEEANVAMMSGNLGSGRNNRPQIIVVS